MSRMSVPKPTHDVSPPMAHLEEADEDHQEEEDDGRASVSLSQLLARLLKTRRNPKELEEQEGPPASCENQSAPARTPAPCSATSGRRKSHRAPEREDKVREVTFPVEQEAPAQASEATATATSSSSVLSAICISSVKLVQVQVLVCQQAANLPFLSAKAAMGIIDAIAKRESKTEKTPLPGQA